MICKICESEYEGHPNSKYCSDNCKKIAKRNTNLKYSCKQKNKKQAKIDENKLDGEIWKPVNVEHFRHYSISNKGRVKSKIRKGGGGFLKIQISNRGYPCVTLRNKDFSKKGHVFSVHRLLALSFIDNPNDYPCVDHINRIKTDNRLENLRWCTYSLNSKNREVKGCICETYDERMTGQGFIIYRYYRVYYRGKSKRFKSMNDAKEYLESIRYDDHYINDKLNDAGT